jgi:hypothetical protein
LDAGEAIFDSVAEGKSRRTVEDVVECMRGLRGGRRKGRKRKEIWHGVVGHEEGE